MKKSINNNKTRFSFERLMAIMTKEFILIKRDRLTLAMLIGIPLMQLILFGYAINTNPRNLPTAILSFDHSQFTRAFIKGLENTKYFSIVKIAKSKKEANSLISKGKVQFIITIPSSFTRDLVRDDSNHPAEISIDADATDPVASGRALSAINSLKDSVFSPFFVGKLSYLRPRAFPVNIVEHARYNPEAITEYNIVPGLLGVILTMTMIMITSMAITKEHEIGTMETLLSTPTQPIEVMVGKILPYIIIGYIQVFLIIFAAMFLFKIPIFGSTILLIFSTLPFIAANLAVGMTFSSLAKTQLQAIQMTFFFFLPSILLSGFMFPFKGMPDWAQAIGNILPLTHFIMIVRGVMLKGNTFVEILPHMWPILLFMIIVLIIGAKIYRTTLD